MEGQSRPLTRQQIAEFIPNRRAQISYENLQGDQLTTIQILNEGSFVTTEADSDLPGARTLTGSDNVSVTDDLGGHKVTLDLTDTGVTAGTYGAATKLVILAVDEFGRVTSASQVNLESGNVAETTNLFFTTARARTSVSGSAGITYTVGTGDFVLDQAFSRGLLSATGQISYNAGTGAIGSAGFSGTLTPPLSLTFVNGICTAGS